MQRVGVVYGLHLGDYKFKYVGLTRYTAEERLRNHRNTTAYRHRHDKKLTPVQNWLKKHGSRVQTCELEEITSSVEDLAESEVKWIAILGTVLPNGFNIMKGGQGTRGHTGFKHSDEARRKMSEKNKGRPAWNKGRPSPVKGVKRDPEIGRKISAAKKGQSSNWRGKKHTAETRVRMSAAAYKRPPMSQETKDKISATKRALK